MRKECPNLHGYRSMGFGTERRAMSAALFSRPSGTFRRPFNTPRSATTQFSVQQPRAQGKMNALTQQEARTSNAVVEGITCIMGHTARVLFDPGATHSFVSTIFASKLNKKPEPLEFQLIIATPIGAEIIASMCYKGCEVMIGEVKTWVDLIKLGRMEYDAILGMDWLSTHMPK